MHLSPCYGSFRLVRGVSLEPCSDFPLTKLIPRALAGVTPLYGTLSLILAAAGMFPTPLTRLTAIYSPCAGGFSCHPLNMRVGCHGSCSS